MRAHIRNFLFGFLALGLTSCIYVNIIYPDGGDVDGGDMASTTSSSEGGARDAIIDDLVVASTTDGNTDSSTKNDSGTTADMAEGDGNTVDLTMPGKVTMDFASADFAVTGKDLSSPDQAASRDLATDDRVIICVDIVHQCGGVCPRCAVTGSCGNDSDCLSDNCYFFRCIAAPYCSDGKIDGPETDIDCGGGACNACHNGQFCALDIDCYSKYCEQSTGQCAPKPLAGPDMSMMAPVDLASMPDQANSDLAKKSSPDLAVGQDLKAASPDLRIVGGNTDLAAGGKDGNNTTSADLGSSADQSNASADLFVADIAMDMSVTDLSQAPDLSITHDLAVPIDLAKSTVDLKQAPDLKAASVDLATGVDLSTKAPDLSQAPDLSITHDLAVPIDLAKSTVDLKQAPDLKAASVDLATGVDLSTKAPDLKMAPDLSITHDLAIASPDLATKPDLSQAPDLKASADLASANDLMTPADLLSGTADLTPGPNCGDGVQNQNETGVDCGGVCSPCALGSACKANTDCVSGVCGLPILLVVGTCVQGWVSTSTTAAEAATCGGATVQVEVFGPFNMITGKYDVIVSLANLPADSSITSLWQGNIQFTTVCGGVIWQDWSSFKIGDPVAPWYHMVIDNTDVTPFCRMCPGYANPGQVVPTCPMPKSGTFPPC